MWYNVIYQGEDLGQWIVINKNGEIMNPKTGTIRKQNIMKTGYYFIVISMGSRDKYKCIKTHKAMAETFIPNPENKPVVNHIDGNKLNNSIENLEWCTQKENMQHAWNNELIKSVGGIDNINSKLTKEEVEYIRRNYIPKDKEFGARAMGRKFKMRHSSILKIIKYISYKV